MSGGKDSAYRNSHCCRKPRTTELLFPREFWGCLRGDFPSSRGYSVSKRLRRYSLGLLLTFLKSGNRIWSYPVPKSLTKHLSPMGAPPDLRPMVAAAAGEAISCPRSGGSSPWIRVEPRDSTHRNRRICAGHPAWFPKFSSGPAGSCLPSCGDAHVAAGHRCWPYSWYSWHSWYSSSMSALFLLPFFPLSFILGSSPSEASFSPPFKLRLSSPFPLFNFQCGIIINKNNILSSFSSPKNYLKKNPQKSSQALLRLKTFSFSLIKSVSF